MSHTLQPRSTNPSRNEGSDRLTLYSSAAVAAGVGLLAMAQPAVSEVVVTHKNIPIEPFYETGTLLPLDLNHDGIADVFFERTSFSGSVQINASLIVANKPGNATVTHGEGQRFPLVAALDRGSRVGPSQHFSGAAYEFLEHSSASLRSSGHGDVCANPMAYGHWGGNKPDRFLGIKFQINGETHYGWVRITVAHSIQSDRCPRMTATITAYAYETVANREITIGSDSSAAENADLAPVAPSRKSPSLGALALGANGLDLWRREETMGPLN